MGRDTPEGVQNVVQNNHFGGQNHGKLLSFNANIN